MNAIEGIWGVARGLGDKGRAGASARREREAFQAEALNRMMEPVLQRVCEGIEAEFDRTNSRALFDEAESEVLFGRVMARFHKRQRGLGGIARGLKMMATLWTTRSSQLFR